MKKIFSKKDISAIADMVMAHIKKHRNKNDATVVALSGDLGAGKTTLVQAIAKELGIRRKLVSPTFVLLKSYKIPKGGEWSELHHIDAYRLTDPKHIKHIRFEEISTESRNLIIIEWPEQVGKYLPKHAVKIELSHDSSENFRKIQHR
jgi:tRNA threonylcarbamoyladenosine biosynthesis protein TsaE